MSSGYAPVCAERRPRQARPDWVRLLLLPVILCLLGKWAWWLPKPLDRLLPDVRFGRA